jgi:hypothetical protein
MPSGSANDDSLSDLTALLPIRAEGRPIARDIASLHARLIARTTVLRWLMDQQVIRTDDKDACLALDRHIAPPSSWTSIVLDPSPIAAWEAALANLRSDATAPLPTLAPPGAPG